MTHGLSLYDTFDLEATYTIHYKMGQTSPNIVSALTLIYAPRPPILVEAH